MTLPNWTREPLVHFLIAGALVFALFAWRGSEVDPASRVIDVDREVQAELAIRFERTMGRAPTDAELDAQIERYVRDEVLYREALRLGLDQGDAVVRRRLVSKMDMAAGSAAEAAQPSEEALRAWYEENAQEYRADLKLSFDQAYFSDRADAALAAGREDPVGEPISLPASLDDRSLRDVADRFGEEFAAAMARLEPAGGWQGPLRSGFGWHIVRLRERTGGGALPFEAVRDRVENDWRSATIAARKEDAYQILRDAYRVEISR